MLAGMPGHDTHERIGGGIACSAACANVGFGMAELRAEVFANQRRRPTPQRMEELLASPRLTLPSAGDAAAWQELYYLLDAFYPRDYGVWAALNRRAEVPPYVRDLIAGRAGKHLQIYPVRDVDARLA
jgi:hypothetical protein